MIKGPAEGWSLLMKFTKCSAWCSCGKSRSSFESEGARSRAGGRPQSRRGGGGAQAHFPLEEAPADPAAAT